MKNLKSKIDKLINHKGFKKYLFNTSWLFLGRFFQLGIGFFVGVWVARYLGPAKFGLLSFSRSFVGLFMAMATLGLDGILIRELVRNESKKDVLLGTSFILKLVGSIIAVLLISIFINFTTKDLLTKCMVVIIAFSLVFQSINVVDLYFQSMVMSKLSVITQIITSAISALIKICLIIFNASVIYFAFITVFDVIILGIGYIYFYKKYTKKTLLKWKFDFYYAKNLLRDSWPLIFSGIAVGIYMKIDQVMLKYMLDEKAVGIYSVAVRLCEIWYIIPMVITSSLFPAIINAKKQSEKIYYERLQKLYDLMVWLAIMIALPTTFFSEWIVKLLYGMKYIEASNILKIYIWAGVFIFLGVAYSKWLINENYTRKNLYRTLLGAIVNVILNIFLIKEYGIKGAAFATLVSQMISNILYDFIDKDVRIALKQKLRALLLIDLFLGIHKIK